MIRIRVFYLLLLASSLFLSGCGSNRAWTSANFNQPQAQVDNMECRQEADIATASAVTVDMYQDYKKAEAFYRIYARCMQLRGYKLVDKNQAPEGAPEFK